MIQNLKKIMLLTAAMILSYSAFSQVVKFRKVIGNTGYDYGYSSKQTFDKGYVIGGSTSTFGSGNTDMYVVKTDSMGVPYGHKTIGGINIDQGKCIRQTSDSGYVFLGYTNSYGAGGYDLYLVKMDSSFNILWTKTYGGTDWDFGNCVEQTTDGGYILCGSTYSYGNGDKDYYLIKTNSIGDTIWTKTFGGIKEDEAKSVIQTSDGGYILTGTTKSMGDTLGDFYTIKTDSFGDTTWTNRWGNSTCLDYANDILESQFGGYMICGETQSFSFGNSDGFVMNLNPAGLPFGPTYRTYAAGLDNLMSITEDVLGRIAMVGRFDVDGNGKGDVFLAILKSDWSNYAFSSFGGANYDIGNSIETTQDYGFIICGTTNSFNNYLEDVYLIKTDSICDNSSWTSMFDSIFTTGVTENTLSQKNNMQIYPNPSSTLINIAVDNPNSPISIIVYDLLGKELKSEKNIAPIMSSVSMNISELPDGIYIIQISSESISFSQKMVVQH